MWNEKPPVKYWFFFAVNCMVHEAQGIDSSVKLRFDFFSFFFFTMFGIISDWPFFTDDLVAEMKILAIIIWISSFLKYGKMRKCKERKLN